MHYNHEFELKPSKMYLVSTLIVLLMSINIVLFLPIEIGLKLFIILLVMTYGGTILWRYVFLRSHQSILRIKRISDGKWWLQTPKHIYEGELCGLSTVTSLVSVLRFYVPKQRWPKSCVVFRDSLKPDDYRQLMVMLRMEKGSREVNDHVGDR